MNAAYVHLIRFQDINVLQWRMKPTERFSVVSKSLIWNWMHENLCSIGDNFHLEMAAITVLPNNPSMICILELTSA